MKSYLSHKAILTAAVLLGELTRLSAYATEFEPLGKAVAAALGTKQAFKKSFAFEGKPLDVFYAKGDGRSPASATSTATKYAFVQKGIYEPNCTHTWVVGIDAVSLKVTEVRTVEMACPHAYPTKSETFVGQFKGKGIADADKLKKEIAPIAKATGSSDLMVEAVRRSLVAASKLKGKI